MNNAGDHAATAVSRHYDRWPFPGTDHTSPEGLALLRYLSEWLGHPGASGARLLDVGCGTGHTVVALARRLPAVEFVGVDVSSTAIDQARDLVDAAGLANLHLQRADATGSLERFGTFDVVLALGVLHHVPEVSTALANLVARLKPGGRLVLWMYGRHGRATHMLNRKFLDLLGDPARGDEDREALAQAFLEDLGDRYAADAGFYTPRGSGTEGIRWLLEHPAWLADQMFPAYEQPVTLDDLFQMFDAHGLTFEHWFGVSEDPARWTTHPYLKERLAALPRRARLVALECLLRPAYYFVSGRRTEPVGEG